MRIHAHRHDGMAAAVFPGVLGWRTLAVALLSCLVVEGFRGLYAPSATWESEQQLQQQWSQHDSLARNIAGNLTCSSSDMEDRRGSRENFLKDHAVGVGLGLATGLTYEPQPGNALFGERSVGCRVLRSVRNCATAAVSVQRVVFRCSRKARCPSRRDMHANADVYVHRAHVLCRGQNAEVFARFVP